MKTVIFILLMPVTLIIALFGGIVLLVANTAISAWKERSWGDFAAIITAAIGTGFIVWLSPLAIPLMLAIGIVAMASFFVGVLVQTSIPQ